MKNRDLHEALPFLDKTSKERQRQFENYFATAPSWLIDLFQYEELEAGKIFIRENEPADTIYFIGDGRVKATDYRISGVSYDLMKPRNLLALGGMEVIMSLDCYQTTLQTETRCSVAKLPRSKYEKWLCSDLEAFRREAYMTCSFLLEESRRNRLYLFSQGEERLALLLLEWYEKNNQDSETCIKASRQDIADETGLCLKSVSRAIKKLADEDVISKKGNLIVINLRQYEKLKSIVQDRIEQMEK